MSWRTLDLLPACLLLVCVVAAVAKAVTSA